MTRGPSRRATLVAVLSHLAPPAPASPRSEQQAEALAASATENLGTDRFAPFVPAIDATLDELAERADAGHGRPFPALDESDREALLRALEAGDNPHLAHAVAVLLQLAIEAFWGGVEAPGLAQVGLPPAGQERCLWPAGSSGARE